MKYLDLAIVNEQIEKIDIKGSEYTEVAQRINAFRKLYPEGFIDSELISNENGIAVIEAHVGYYKEETNGEGNRYLQRILLGTGIAYEKEDSSFINKTSYIENCQTSAVGRALGMAGFGIKTDIASYEEMETALKNQVITKEDADKYELKFGRHKGKTIKQVYEEDKKYIDWLIQNTKDDRFRQIIELSLGIKIPSEEELKEKCELMIKLNAMDLDHEELHKKYKVEDITDLSIEQLKEIVNGIR